MILSAFTAEYKMWEQFTTGGFSNAQRLDALKSSHPVIVPIQHAEEVEQVFDAISYNKGSTVVNMVSAFLGKCKRRPTLLVLMTSQSSDPPLYIFVLCRDEQVPTSSRRDCRCT